jgi:hypothetical protein
MGRFAAIVWSRKISALQGRKNVIAGAKAPVSSKGQRLLSASWKNFKICRADL